MAIPQMIEDLLAAPEFTEGDCWLHRDFSEGEEVISEGGTDRQLFVVVSGQLEVTGVVDLDDQRRIKPGIYRFGPGDIFGELCLFNDQTRTATVAGLENGRLLVIDADRLQAYMDDNPVQGYQILKSLFGSLVQRLSKANKRVEHLFAWGLKAHRIDEHL